jgi:hypothetical protein
MIELDLKPDIKKLRQFGWICLVGFGVIGLVIAKKTGAFEEPDKWMVPGIFWVLAIICPIIGMIAPRGLVPIYLLLTLIAFPIGLVISNVLLFVIFALLITPLALWFKLVGRDELLRKWPAEGDSYWIKSKAPGGAASYYRQF